MTPPANNTQAPTPTNKDTKTTTLAPGRNRNPRSIKRTSLPLASIYTIRYAGLRCRTLFRLCASAKKRKRISDFRGPLQVQERCCPVGLASLQVSFLGALGADVRLNSYFGIPLRRIWRKESVPVRHLDLRQTLGVHDVALLNDTVPIEHKGG